jgi:glycine cleavage system protein P-like pyridoxal-binding family
MHLDVTRSVCGSLGTGGPPHGEIGLRKRRLLPQPRLTLRVSEQHRHATNLTDDHEPDRYPFRIEHTRKFTTDMAT